MTRPLPLSRSQRNERERRKEKVYKILHKLFRRSAACLAIVRAFICIYITLAARAAGQMQHGRIHGGRPPRRSSAAQLDCVGQRQSRRHQGKAAAIHGWMEIGGGMQEEERTHARP